MIEKELEGFFVADEKKFRREDIARLIGKLKKYAKLIGKDGKVHIENKRLSGTDKSKILLIARYLGGELAKLKPELGIKKEISSVTIKEVAEFLSIDEPNSRARISQLVEEGFAKRPTRGSVQIEPFQIERFLNALEKSKDESISTDRKLKAPKKSRVAKKKQTKTIVIDEVNFFDNLSKFLSIDKEKIKDLIHIRNHDSFKLHNISGKSKAAKQKNCVLCSGYIYLFGLRKKTFSSREIADICYHSGIDPNGLNYTIRHMKESDLITKAGRRSQDNILREMGKAQARKILQELCK